MKLKYYGTCAAEGIPALFCSCEVCEKARRLGGRNIRSRTQALINDDLLIDFPADTYMHTINYGLDLRKVKACLITHGHEDHLYPLDFLYRTKPYGYFPNNDKGKEPLDIYSTALSGDEIRKAFASAMIYEKDEKAVKYHKVEYFQQYDIAGYRVTPLRANHAPELDPAIYIIEKDNKTILYGHDTGYFCKDTWEYIENSDIKFDLVSLDCTNILDDDYEYHMGLKRCSEVKERLLKKNADDKTIFVLNHFSHNGGLIYDELVPIAKELGFITSFDSMEIEI